MFLICLREEFLREDICLGFDVGVVNKCRVRLRWQDGVDKEQFPVHDGRFGRDLRGAEL